MTKDGKIFQNYLYVKQLGFVIQKMISIPAGAGVKALASISDVLVNKRVLRVQPSATMALLAKIFLMWYSGFPRNYTPSRTTVRKNHRKHHSANSREKTGLATLIEPYYRKHCRTGIIMKLLYYNLKEKYYMYS